MSDPQRPLTDEERAAKEHRLTELRSRMNTSGGASALPNSNQGQSGHRNNTTQSNNGFGNTNEAHPPAQDRYSSDAEEEVSEGEAEFLRQVEHGSGSAGVHVYKTQMDELLGQIIETGPHDRRSTVGDFELLRLAKMGDCVSFLEFFTMMGINPVTFRDNHDRNALHYAADGGDVAMLQYLIDLRVPFLRDEKKMNPLDIAVLNQHAAAVRLLASAFPEHEASAAQTHDAAIEAFAPPPPRFTVSKPIPPAKGETRPRTFWTAAPITEEEEEATAAASAAGGDFSVAAIAAEDTARRGAVLDALCGLLLSRDSVGLLAWLPPAERVTLHAALSRASVFSAFPKAQSQSQSQSQGTEAQGTVAGAVLALPLGGRLMASAASAGSAGSIARRPVLVAQLALLPALRGGGTATAMLSALRRDVDTDAVVFRSARQLPAKAVGLVKWSRRAIDPCGVFARSYAAEVFPDFFLYDGVLRADIIAKNAMTESFRAEKEAHREGWRCVERNNTEQVEQLQSFIKKHADSAFELAYVPDTVDDTLATILADGLSGFVYVSPETGLITDFFVLRLRRPECMEGSDDNNDADTGKKVEVPPTSTCVYALFTSFKGPEKAEEIFFLSSTLKCETVLIPNMFGFMDSDLSKAKFEELLPLREYLYVLKDTTETLVAPMPLSKVGIPCAFL